MKKNKCYIIAEIGINHNGNFKILSKLIKLAKKAGADAVKFQLFNPETLASKKDPKKYKLFKNKPNQTLFEMWKSVAIKKKWPTKIKNLSKKIKIDLGFSVFDEQSLNQIRKIKPNFIKIASSDITDLNLLNKIKKTKPKHIIMSTGMASKNEIINAFKIFNKNISLLHCVSLYPTDYKELNLNRMVKLNNITKNVGFSDHSLGVIGSINAIALGAKILEKHFTFDKKAYGPDHQSSADFNDLKIICEFAKNKNNMLGNGKIEPSKKEIKMRLFARKSIYARKNIKKGDKFSENNLVCKRPGDGTDAKYIFNLIGKKSSKLFKKDDKIIF